MNIDWLGDYALIHDLRADINPKDMDTWSVPRYCWILIGWLQ